MVVRSSASEMCDAIEWAGLIPGNWQIKKARWLFSERNEKGNPVTVQLLTPSQKYGVLPQSLYEDISGTKPVQVGADKDLSEFKTVRKGDFCISLSAYMGGFEYSEYDGVISPAYHSFYKVTDEIENAYYKYLFKSQAFIDIINLITPQSVRVGRNTSFESFKDVVLPVPPLKEQQAIADYLDKCCSKIDELIKEITDSIEEYTALKQAVIDKYTIVKDYNLVKLKYIALKIGDGIHTTPKYNDEGTYQFINGGAFGKEQMKMNGNRISEDEYLHWNTAILNSSTIMIALNGVNYGNTSLYQDEAILLGKSAGYITLKEGINRKYIRYCLANSLSRERIDLSLNGTTIPNLSLNTLRNLSVYLPDNSVQDKIVDELDMKISMCDGLIEEKEQLLNELQEYKKSIIYEIVTGKKRVV